MCYGKCEGILLVKVECLFCIPVFRGDKDETPDKPWDFLTSVSFFHTYFILRDSPSVSYADTFQRFSPIPTSHKKDVYTVVLPCIHPFFFAAFRRIASQTPVLFRQQKTHADREMVGQIFRISPIMDFSIHTRLP